MEKLFEDEIGYSVAVEVFTPELSMPENMLRGLAALEPKFPNVILQLIGDKPAPEELEVLANLQSKRKMNEGKLILVSPQAEIFEVLAGDSRLSALLFGSIPQALNWLFGVGKN